MGGKARFSPSLARAAEKHQDRGPRHPPTRAPRAEEHCGGTVVEPAAPNSRGCRESIGHPPSETQTTLQTSRKESGGTASNAVETSPPARQALPSLHSGSGTRWSPRDRQWCRGGLAAHLGLFRATQHPSGIDTRDRQAGAAHRVLTLPNRQAAAWPRHRPFPEVQGAKRRMEGQDPLLQDPTAPPATA